MASIGSRGVLIFRKKEKNLFEWAFCFSTIYFRKKVIRVDGPQCIYRNLFILLFSISFYFITIIFFSFYVTIKIVIHIKIFFVTILVKEKINPTKYNYNRTAKPKIKKNTSKQNFRLQYFYCKKYY